MTLMEPIPTVPVDAAFIRCDAAELKKAVLAAVSVVERRNTIPVLDCLRITPSKGRLTLDATNLDTCMKISCAAQAVKATPFLIRAAVLRSLLQTADDADMVTIARGADALSIQIGPVTARLRELIDHEDFPSEIVVGGDHVEIGEGVLAGLLDKVSFAISTEEARYYLNGIYLHPVNGMLAAAATDGHRIALATTQVPWPLAGVIFPRCSVAALRRRLTPGGNQTVVISADPASNRISFKGADWSLACKTIDGTFPDYTRVIPARDPKAGYAVLSRETLRRLTVVHDNRARAIKVDLAQRLASIRAVSFGVEIDLPIEADGTFAIGFNGNYLRDIAQRFGTFRIEATSTGDPAHVLTEDPDLTVVVMPMRIS